MYYEHVPCIIFRNIGVVLPVLSRWLQVVRRHVTCWNEQHILAGKQSMLTTHKRSIYAVQYLSSMLATRVNPMITIHKMRHFFKKATFSISLHVYWRNPMDKFSFHLSLHFDRRFLHCIDCAVISLFRSKCVKHVLTCTMPQGITFTYASRYTNATISAKHEQRLISIISHNGMSPNANRVGASIWSMKNEPSQWPASWNIPIVTCLVHWWETH